jgi:hypothetical protein
MCDNPPPSAADFTHSGDEAPLVNEKNLGKTKTEYNIEVNMTVKCKDNEVKRKAKDKEDIPPKRSNLISDEWLTSPPIISLHSFCLQAVVFRPKKIYPGSHYSIG